MRFHYTTRWLPALLVAVSSFLFVAFNLQGVAVADAATGPWSKPVELSDPAASAGAWFPTIAADDQGNAYASWSGPYANVGRLDVYGMWFTRWDGQSWNKPTDIATSWSGDTLRNSLAVDVAGRVFALAKILAPNGPDVPRDSAQERIWSMSTHGTQSDRLSAWSTPVRVSRNASYFANLAIDSHGTLHAIWTEADGTGAWGIYYAHSTDGGKTWSPRVPLDGSHFVWWYRAQLKVDNQDRLHVVWETLAPKQTYSMVTYRTYYATSSDGGQTWNTTEFPHEVVPNLPGQTSAGPQQPAIGIDGNGTVLLVYRDPMSNQILWERSTDGQHWSTPSPIPGVAKGIARPYDMYDMVTDSAGHVHLVMVGDLTVTGSTPDDAKMSLLHSKWDGSSWASTPDVIVSAPPYPEYPRLAIGQGNHLYVTWFDGDKVTTDRNPIGVWVSSVVVNAPQIARAGTPVPFSGGSVGAPVAVTPAVTPIPTINVFGDSSSDSAAAPAPSRPPSDSAIVDFRDNPALGATLGPAMVLPVVLLTLLARSYVVNRRRLADRLRRSLSEKTEAIWRQT